jgi:carbonic anhydrase/acetyltransferase-like protein (isoleucine patch superfamily)
VIYSLGERSPELQGDGHFIADNATIIGSVRLKDKASVWFNCVLRGDNDWLEIGERSNIQDGSVLPAAPGVPRTIGNDVTVGHQVLLHGCSIGNNSLFGMGSTVLNNAKIGNNCLVGAHALITENKEFPDGSLILGSPAKVVRQLNDEEIAQIRWSAKIYVENAARFRSDLLPRV